MGVINWHDVVMLDNNTPTPYKVQASSMQDVNHDAYGAFNGVYADYNATGYTNCWASLINNIVNSWIQINYGEAVRVNKVELVPRANAYLSQTPVRFKVMGSSDDGSSWEELGNFHITDWVAQQATVLDLKESNHSLYRIHHFASSTTNCSWAHIRFGYSENEVFSSFRKNGETFILKGKEKLTFNPPDFKRYAYNESEDTTEWADDITRLAEIKSVSTDGRLELTIDSPGKYHTVRGIN